MKTVEPGLVSPRRMDPNAALLALLGHPNIASKADVIRIYDHEVQGGTVVKPLTGALNDGPSDACVLKPLGTRGTRGIALASGINPHYGKLDPYRMAVSVIDEAIRNAVAVGADPERIALLDNFCWGDPRRPDTLGALVEAGRGCYDAALHYRTPFISGKDSLNNEYTGADGQRQAIPPTLLISVIGILEDVNQAVTMDLKTPGDPVYLLGRFLAGSGSGDPSGGNPVPGLPEEGPRLYRALHRTICAGLVRACHDLSEGGLAAAAAEMCIGGRLGLALTVDAGSPETSLFGETNGCLLVEVACSEKAAFESHLAGLPFLEVGAVSSDSRLTIRSSEGPSNEGVEFISLPVPDLVAAWNRIP